MLVVDSVAALVPKAELDGEMGDSHMGLQARLMSQALRKLTGTVSKSRTALIFINQIREKIGVMFGNPETTTGGRALKFYSSVRIDIRRIAAIKEGDAVTGNRTKVKIVKNKVAAPFREAEFDILYGEGISREGDVLDLAVANNIVEKSGAWYSYSGERIGQGRENTRTFLKENKDIFAKMDAELRKKLNIGAPPRPMCPKSPPPATPKPRKPSAPAAAKRTDPSHVPIKMRSPKGSSFCSDFASFRHVFRALGASKSRGDAYTGDGEINQGSLTRFLQPVPGKWSGPHAAIPSAVVQSYVS